MMYSHRSSVKCTSSLTEFELIYAQDKRSKGCLQVSSLNIDTLFVEEGCSCR